MAVNGPSPRAQKDGRYIIMYVRCTWCYSTPSTVHVDVASPQALLH